MTPAQNHEHPPYGLPLSPGWARLDTTLRAILALARPNQSAGDLMMTVARIRRLAKEALEAELAERDAEEQP